MGKTKIIKSAKLHVLLADDDELNRQIITSLLSHKGLDVDIAPNGFEALVMSEKTKYDLILMDVEMPQMGGLQTTMAIREREKKIGGRIPIFAMTAHSFASDLEACRNAGMDDYLSKPLNVDEMFAKLEILLKQNETSGLAMPDEKEGGQESEDVPVIDIDALVAELGEKNTYNLIALFMKTGASYMEIIRMAIEAGDLNQIKTVAHKLKGAAAQYRAPTIVPPAAFLSNLDNDETLETIWGKFSELEREFTKVVEVITDLKNRRT